MSDADEYYRRMRAMREVDEIFKRARQRTQQPNFMDALRQEYRRQKAAGKFDQANSPVVEYRVHCRSCGNNFSVVAARLEAVPWIEECPHCKRQNWEHETHQVDVYA